MAIYTPKYTYSPTIDWEVIAKEIANKMVEERVKMIKAEWPIDQNSVRVNHYGETEAFNGADWIVVNSPFAKPDKLTREESEMSEALYGPEIDERAVKPVEPEKTTGQLAAELMQEYARDLTNWFQVNRKEFMLGEPAGITVKKKDGNYSKLPHIGGEYFVPKSAYVGKRGANLIFVFEPVAVSDYAQAEFSNKEAEKMLVGFKTYMKGADHDLGNNFEKIKSLVSKDKEAKLNSGKFKQYEDLGFGSF